MKHLLLSLTLICTLGSNAEGRACSEELESELSQLPLWMQENVPQTDTQLVSRQCITEAMNHFYSWTRYHSRKRKRNGETNIGHFSYCKGDSDTNAIIKTTPPCKSTQYLNVIQQSYQETLSCLNLDPRHFFPIVAVESGFHVNSLSPSAADIGIGQLTPIAIEHVNENWTDSLKLIVNSKNESCQKIATVLDGIKQSGAPENLVCSMTAVPQNPIKNLLYMAFLYIENIKNIDKKFTDSLIVQKINQIIEQPLRTDEIKRIKLIIATLAYNAGGDFALDAFESFLQTKFDDLVENQISIERLQSERATLYLMAMSFAADGMEDKKQDLLDQREVLKKEIQDLKKNLDDNKLPSTIFSIAEIPGSFGSYLIEQGLSKYLRTLDQRVSSIERNLNLKKGSCGSSDSLTF